jgi:hypothetical protein
LGSKLCGGDFAGGVGIPDGIAKGVGITDSLVIEASIAELRGSNVGSADVSLRPVFRIAELRGLFCGFLVHCFSFFFVG